MFLVRTGFADRLYTGGSLRTLLPYVRDLHVFPAEENKVVTDVFMSLDVFQHGPLLAIPVVSSLSVGLKLLDSGGGGSA